MRPGEPILVICHSFPPNFDIGGRRWAKFAKELARRGHPVHVILSAGTQRDKVSLWMDDVRHPNIFAHPLPNRYPNVLTRWPVTGLRDKLRYAFWTRMLPLLTRGNWFDRAVFWRKPLLRSAEALIREHGIRNVVATGAPFSLLAYATELKQQFPNLQLVSDLRDMWTWGTDYGVPSMAPERLEQEKKMEARVAHLSDKLISPHATVIDHLRRTYGGAPERYMTVPHAIDPEDFDLEPVPKQDDVFRMIYAGSLYGAEQADHYFGALLDAFDVLRRERPEVYAKCHLDLYITSHGTTDYERQAKERGANDRIHFHAPIPPKAIFKRMARADLVLTFIPSMNRDVLGTKFNEIFHLQRPILHIGDPGLVSRTIKEQQMGDSIRLEELVTELPRIISGERTVTVGRETDQQGHLLEAVTDLLLREVLV